jgi:hypothetical protein
MPLIPRKIVIEPSCVDRELQPVWIEHIQAAQYGDRKRNGRQYHRRNDPIVPYRCGAKERSRQCRGREQRSCALSKLIDLAFLLFERLLGLFVDDLVETRWRYETRMLQTDTDNTMRNPAIRPRVTAAKAADPAT